MEEPSGRTFIAAAKWHRKIMRNEKLSEYLNALRERHNTIHQVNELEVKPGDVAMIKGEEKNRGMWKFGVVESLITGRDGVTRAVKLRAGKCYSERAIQYLYLNVQAREFRPKRQSAANASAIIRELAEDESQEI